MKALRETLKFRMQRFSVHGDIIYMIKRFRAFTCTQWFGVHGATIALHDVIFVKMNAPWRYA